MDYRRFTPRFAARFVPRKEEAARKALAICEAADRLTSEALANSDTTDEQLFELLERREEILQSLAEHIVSLKLERPTADGRLLAASERAADEADDLVASVCVALDRSHQATVALAARVALRVTELRRELAQVQQMGSAATAYSAPRAVRAIDSFR